MLTVIMHNVFSVDQLAICGMFVLFFLITSLSIAEIFVKSKYDNVWLSHTLEMCNNSLLIFFILFVVFEILLIL